MVVFLELGVESPVAEVWRLVNILAVVPLEVSVVSVETLELKKEVITAKLRIKLVVRKDTYKFQGCTSAAIIVDGFTDSDAGPEDKHVDLVVDGLARVIEPLSPAAADVGGDSFASALGELLLDRGGDTVPILFDFVLESLPGIAVDTVDKHVDSATELGDVLSGGAVVPVVPDFFAEKVWIVGELTVGLLEEAGVGGGGKYTSDFHFWFFSFLIETLDDIS